MKADIALKKELLKGNDGGYYVPNVDQEYNLAFTASRADMPTVETVDLQEIMLDGYFATNDYQKMVKAEYDRMGNEVDRRSSEIEREKAEEQRTADEAERTAAETNRQAAETERVEAESDRRSEFSTAMAEWNNSVSTAVENATAANTAAQDAYNVLLGAAHANAIIETKTGALVNIADAAAAPIRNGRTTITEADSITIHAIGKNFIPYANTDVIEIEYSNSTGTKTKVKGYIVSLPPGKYVASGEYKPNYNGGVHIYCMKIDKDNVITQTTGRIIAGANTLQADIEIENGERLLIYNGSSASQSLSYSKTQFGKVNLMVSAAGNNTAYEPYNGVSYTIDLPQSAMNGEYDWVSGKFTDSAGAQTQLTAHPITLQYKYNNIWSDNGDTQIQYIADTKAYIDNKFEEIQRALIVSE